MSPSPTASQRILVFRMGQLGDTIAALPSLWVLRRQFPDAFVLLLSETPAKKTHLPPESVLPPFGLVDRFEKYPTGTSVASLIAAWRCIRGLRTEGFSTLVYLTPSARSKRQRLRDRIFFRFCGIKQLLAINGFSEFPCPRSADGGLEPLLKEADALLLRLKLDGMDVPDRGQGCMNMGITEAEHEAAQNWWRKHAGERSIPNGWIAVCTGGKLTYQKWPWGRYAEVGRRLIDDRGIFPVVVGGMEDREIGERLLAAWGSGLCAAGELSVRESAALISGARLYLGNDTGVMHLAAAVGVPCVSPFSARNWPGIWEPYGNGHKVLRVNVPCEGCMLSVCDRNLECLTNISADRVYEACLETVDRQKNGRAI